MLYADSDFVYLVVKIIWSTPLLCARRNNVLKNSDFCFVSEIFVYAQTAIDTIIVVELTVLFIGKLFI